MPSWIRQSGVIPMRAGEVCLVTSSSGKRWVLPKGLIDTGKTAGEAALQEAWEEAGLVGVLHSEPVGSYVYEKYSRTHHVTMFLLTVTEVCDDWPERRVRRREWLRLEQACTRIEEPGLQEILLTIGQHLPLAALE